MAGEQSEVIVGCCSDDPQGVVTVWDLNTGSEITHFYGSPSPLHSVLPISTFSLAASSFINPQSHIIPPICFWIWNSSQPHFQIQPSEQIGPLVCTSDGAYLLGGGFSGSMHVWDLATGQLVRSFQAHRETVQTLALADDESLVVSGANDGCINVWPLIWILDVAERSTQTVLPLHSFAAHSLTVTGLACGVGGCNAVLVSSSLDSTVKIWSLGLGTELRNILMPSAIRAIALDPTEHLLYAGGSDGNICIAVVNVVSRKEVAVGSENGIIGSLSGHRGAITGLVFGTDGLVLISASEDCTMRIWDTCSNCIVRIIECRRGPLNSIFVFPLVEYDVGLQSYGCCFDDKWPVKSGMDEFGELCLCDSMEVIGRRLKECDKMKGHLGVVMEDRKKALDMLDKMIHVYKKILEFSMREAITQGETNTEGSHDLQRFGFSCRGTAAEQNTF